MHEIPDVVSDETIGPPIYRGLKHEFIARIAKLRAPPEMNFNRFNRDGESAKKTIDIRKTEPGRTSLLVAFQHVLVLQKQARRGERDKTLPPNLHQQSEARAVATAQRGRDDRGVENHPAHRHRITSRAMCIQRAGERRS